MAAGAGMRRAAFFCAGPCPPGTAPRTAAFRAALDASGQRSAAGASSGTIIPEASRPSGSNSRAASPAAYSGLGRAATRAECAPAVQARPGALQPGRPRVGVWGRAPRRRLPGCGRRARRPRCLGLPLQSPDAPSRLERGGIRNGRACGIGVNGLLGSDHAERGAAGPVRHLPPPGLWSPCRPRQTPCA